VAHGGPGADRFAVGGSATVTGGDGHDSITWNGRAGGCYGEKVRISGDSGRDELDLSMYAANWRIVNLAKGFATGTKVGHIALSGIEDAHQYGTPYQGRPEKLIGTAGPNILVGGDSRTLLRGRGGNDALAGGRGRDTAYGGAGRDLCRAEIRHGCEG
jgi:Ca2+-binding RTX toxin-like protein